MPIASVPLKLGFSGFLSRYFLAVISVFVVMFLISDVSVSITFVFFIFLQIVGIGSVAKLSDQNKLPYLCATIKEILRISSPGMISLNAHHKIINHQMAENNASVLIIVSEIYLSY